jgi:putative oxidoreductase
MDEDELYSILLIKKNKESERKMKGEKMLKQKITLIIRFVFGLLLLVLGLNNLLNPSDSMEFSEPANKFMIALVETGYMMEMVYCLMVLVGLSLLINRFVPLALVVLMPISVNMVLFHVFLDLKSIPPSLVIGFLNIYLLFAHIASYQFLLKVKN